MADHTREPDEAEQRAQQAQADRNYEAFQKLLPTLSKTHPGRCALMRDGEVVECFDTARDAAAAGAMLYADGLFSVQEIVDSPVDLGFFSHVASPPPKPQGPPNEQVRTGGDTREKR